MNTDLLNSKDLNLELKNLIDNVDNIKFDIDMYSVIVDEQVLFANV